MSQKTRQYASAKPYADKLSAKIVNAVGYFDIVRLKTYTLYEDIYCNNPESLKLIAKREDSTDQEIYVPSGEKIIEAICRFHAVDPTFELSTATPDVQKLMQDLWDREGFLTKHLSNKRWGSIRGDSLFFLTGNSSKPAGEKISIHDLDPSNYFPIVDPLTSSVTGCYIVDAVPHPDPQRPKEFAARRQGYYKEFDQETGELTNRIIYDSRIFTTGKWDPRCLNPGDIEQLAILQIPMYMPPPISTIPVYLIPNAGGQAESSFFGRSDLAGIETLIEAINKSMTDEDLTLAIAGLGMFWTDAPPPKDSAQNDTDWPFGPARMLEVPTGKQIGRLAGTGSVQPMQDHINAADAFIQQGKGIPEIAIGKVDVNVAESGISLQFQLGPILAKGKEKEAVRRAKQDQMWYDLIHQWFPAFEGTTVADDLRCRTIYGDPSPKDDSGTFDKHVAIFELGIYPIKKFYEALNKLSYGFDLEETDFAIALEEQAKRIKSSSPPDPLGDRMAADTAAANAQQPGNASTNGTGTLAITT